MKQVISGIILLVFSSAAPLLAQPTVPKLPVKPKPVVKTRPQPEKKASSGTSQNTQTKGIESAPVSLNIKFLSDADADLYIDGEKAGALESDIPFKLKLAKGDYLVRLVSRSFPEDAIREKIQIREQDGERLIELSIKELEKARMVQAESFFEKGEVYFWGKGQEVNYDVAISLYKEAMTLGHSGAINMMGWAHQNGLGVAVDNAKAFEWMYKSADKGNAAAMNDIGWAFMNGKGVPQNYAKAMEWLQKSAGLGNDVAMVNQGWMYQNGYGIPKNPEKARQLYEKACELGNEGACDLLKKLN